MFERYTEGARRALYFARWEVGEMGGAAIEPEHLLLGLLRDRTGPMSDLIVREQARCDAIVSEVRARIPRGDAYPTPVEVPFSDGTIRVLHRVAAESDRLGHGTIAIEHLLLGILHEPDTVAARVLVANGIDARLVEQAIAGSG